MKFARTHYRGKPTKWTRLDRYYHIQREIWPELKERLKELLRAGRVSAQAYKFDYDLERNTDWQWIKRKLKIANTKPDPITYLNQLNIYRLELAMQSIEAELERIQTFANEQTRLPLEKTEGWRYNQRYHISEEEYKALAEAENGVELTLSDIPR